MLRQNFQFKTKFIKPYDWKGKERLSETNANGIKAVNMHGQLALLKNQLKIIATPRDDLHTSLIVNACVFFLPVCPSIMWQVT